MRDGAAGSASYSPQRPNLDFPVADPRLVGRLRYRGWAAHNAAVGEPEGAGVPRTNDAAVDKLAFVQWTASVAAGVGQRVQLPLVANQQDRGPIGGDHAMFAFAELRVGEHRGPLRRAIFKHGVVDVDRLGVRQVTAKVSTRHEHSESGKSE